MKKSGNPRRKSKKYKNKASAQTKHAINRIEERYGLHLSETDMRHFSNQIQSGNATFLEKQSNRVSVFSVNTMAGEVPMVYDKQRGTIVTALPGSYVETGSKRWFDDWDD